jgi:hypothetical protein
MRGTRIPNPLLILAGCLFILGADSCQTTVPESDDTPPKINFFIAEGGEDGQTESITSPKEIRLGENPDLSVGAIAEDDEGVKSVILRISKRVYCSDEDRPLRAPDELVEVENPKAEAPESVGIGDETKDTRVVTFVVSDEKLKEDCERFEGSRLDIHATAENFHEGETKSSILTLLSKGYEKQSE